MSTPSRAPNIIRNSINTNSTPSGGFANAQTLILFTERLRVRFAVRIEKFLAAFLPRRFEFGRCDVPVRPAFLGNRTQVLSQLFHSGPPKKPVAVVNLMNHKTRLEHNHVR